MKKLAAVLAVLAVASIAMAAPVQYGVVGGGIHQVYGGGNGIASESYDWWVDGGGWDNTFPKTLGSAGGSVAPSGFEGFIMLALNPYTGEVWTDVPLTHQALNPAGSYSGHAPTFTSADWVSNLTPSATGISEDAIFITGEFRSDGYGAFGSFVTVSSDGAVLGTPDGYGGHAGIDSHLPNNLAVGTLIEPAGSMEWTNDLYGHVGWFSGWGYAGTDGGGTGNYGFEMDGIKGWISLNFSGNRTGVRLNEYYFDVPEPATMSMLAIGGIAALIRRRKS